MMLSEDQRALLFDWLDRLLENNLSQKEKGRLEALVKESEEARKIYVTYLDLHASLSHYADESLGSEIEESLSDRRDSRMIGFLPVLLPLAALVVFGFYLFQSFKGGDDTREEPYVDSLADSSTAYEQPMQSIEPDQVIAVFTKSVGVQWAQGATARPEFGNGLHPGMLRLAAGAAQLEFLQGATVIIEGPAEAELINENEASLKLGRLRAHVPKIAIGFTVNLPMGQVVDLGTDFGLEVYENGSSEVYVYRGSVRYQGVDNEGNEVARELTAGQAIRLDPHGVSSPLDMPAGNYMGSAELADRSLENSQTRRNAWLQNCKILAREESAELYYSFDDQDSWSRVLRDETSKGNGSRDGAVIGCSWTEGRWPGKGALRFTQKNDRVCLNLSEPLNKATLVAWVRLDSLGEEGAPLVFSKPLFNGAVGWSINPTGKLVLQIKAGQSFEQYESAVAFRKEKIGKWVHLATTFDGDRKWVGHFLNGRCFSREKIDRAKVLSLRKGLLGHFQSLAKSKEEESLLGCIDEFAIFSSVWDELQLRKLYEIGRPRDGDVGIGEAFPSALPALGR